MLYSDTQIKVDIKKADALEAALKAVNGTATAHTFTTCDELLSIARAAEKALAATGLIKKERTGAQYTQESGTVLPSSYGFKAKGTQVRLERRASGWYLDAVGPHTVTGSAAGRAVLYLTANQDERAVARLRATYRTMPDVLGVVLS